jgi:hypothetical protein
MATKHAEKEKSVEEYSDDIPFEELFVVKQSEIDSKNPQFRETTFVIDFTEKSVKFMESGNMYQLFPRIIDYVSKICNIRKSEQLYQISVENNLLSYPISTGLHKGVQLDFNLLIDRFKQVEQSQTDKIFAHHSPEITLRVFQRELY